MTTGMASPRRLRLGLLLWLAGMLGVGAITATVLPQELRQLNLPVPPWMVVLVSFAQSALLVALAVWAGVALAPKVGLHAPAFEAAAASRPLAPALRPQLLPGLIAGAVSGVLLLAVGRFVPDALAHAQGRFEISLLARVLYGGVTEELLARWGMMSALLWLGWRSLRQRQGAPQPAYVWAAILVSALLFGAGHLPAAAALLGSINVDVLAFVLGANTLFGVLFGYLFWRHGLESTMIAHVLTHVVHALTSPW